ncbi:MAG: DUF4358 domain-containing protein [Clostridia bacterium]|nr:DUF4358 domain-containing protein [Clostridia bacterium]
MRKMVALTLAAVFVLCFVSCGKKEETEPMVSMYDLRVMMLAADETLPEMKSVSSSDEDAESLFGYLSDVDYSKVEGYFLSYAAEGDSYEIAVVAMRDAGDVPAMKESVEKHVAGRIELYRNYKPEQVPRAEEASVTVSGRYVALVMCDRADAVLEAFKKGIK